MKKIITLLIVFVFAASLVYAVNQKGIHEPGTGLEQNASEDQDIQALGEGKPVQIKQETQNEAGDNAIVQQRQQIKAQTVTEAKQMIQQTQNAMNMELQSKGKDEQKVYQNQNQVRLAVHSLLAMEDLVGGIGPQVSQVARQFNNSVQATIRAEEIVQSRSKFMRFFAGGDENAADEIIQEVSQNKERLQELKQLKDKCEDCTEDVQVMMQEQIQNMELEQNRLQELAQNEKKSKGIFGWLWE